MTKIDKKDIENINFIKKELKLKSITSVKIKKGTYEIELNSAKNINSSSLETIKSSKENTLENSHKDQSDIKAENVIKSPMVGVAYLSPDPNSPAYVKVGQHIKQGEIVLLIEAMKTFNEVKAPKSGIIKKINVLNSQPVEFGDDLIILE